MPSRLDGESTKLAESFRAVDPAEQRRVAEQMVKRAVAEQSPSLELPADVAELGAVLAQLDGSDDDADFRRARAAAAADYLHRADYEEALYEALHARSRIDVAVDEALDALS